MVRVPQKLPILLDSQHSCWPAGPPASVSVSNWSPPRPCGGVSSPWPDSSPARPAASPCIFPKAGPGETNSVAPWRDCAPCRSLPDRSAGNRPADPPSGPRNIPADSHQLGPRRALPAHRLPNYARHGHCGPPESCRCGYLTPPASPSVGIGPAPFAFPCPSSLVSTPATIASVDSG